MNPEKQKLSLLSDKIAGFLTFIKDRFDLHEGKEASVNILSFPLITAPLDGSNIPKIQKAMKQCLIALVN